MPRSKQGIKRSLVNEVDLGATVEDVLKNKTTVYSAAKKYSISKTTLLRHIKTFNTLLLIEEIMIIKFLATKKKNY